MPSNPPPCPPHTRSITPMSLHTPPRSCAPPCPLTTAGRTRGCSRTGVKQRRSSGRSSRAPGPPGPPLPPLQQQHRSKRAACGHRGGVGGRGRGWHQYPPTPTHGCSQGPGAPQGTRKPSWGTPWPSPDPRGHMGTVPPLHTPCTHPRHPMPTLCPRWAPHAQGHPVPTLCPPRAPSYSRAPCAHQETTWAPTHGPILCPLCGHPHSQGHPHPHPWAPRVPPTSCRRASSATRATKPDIWSRKSKAMATAAVRAKVRTAGMEERAPAGSRHPQGVSGHPASVGTRRQRGTHCQRAPRLSRHPGPSTQGQCPVPSMPPRCPVSLCPLCPCGCPLVPPCP